MMSPDHQRSFLLLAFVALAGCLMLVMFLGQMAPDSEGEIPTVSADGTIDGQAISPVELSSEQRLIELLLQRAEQAFEDLRLIAPEQDSALFYYQKILELDPGNVKATAGLHRIVETYAEMASAAR